VKKTYLEKSTFYTCNHCGAIVQECSSCYKEIQFEDVVYCHNQRRKHFCEGYYKKIHSHPFTRDETNKEVNKT